MATKTKKKPEMVVEQTKSAENQNTLSEVTRKVILLYIGIFALAKDEIEALIERGESAQQDANKLLHDAIEKRRDVSSKMEDEKSRQLDSMINHNHFISKADIKTLDEKITQLSVQIDKLSQP
jgi:polyhydroxyalkanoate synthesis regulator phasin